MNPESATGNSNHDATNGLRELELVGRQQAREINIPFIHEGRIQEVQDRMSTLAEHVRSHMDFLDGALNDVAGDLEIVSSGDDDQLNQRLTELTDAESANPNDRSPQALLTSRRRLALMSYQQDKQHNRTEVERLQEEVATQAAQYSDLKSQLESRESVDTLLRARYERREQTLVAITNEKTSPGAANARIEELKAILEAEDTPEEEVLEIALEISALQSSQPDAAIEELIQEATESLSDATDESEQLLERMTAVTERSMKYAEQRDVAVVIALMVDRGNFEGARLAMEYLNKRDQGNQDVPEITDADKEFLEDLEYIIASAENKSIATSEATAQLSAEVDRLNEQLTEVSDISRTLDENQRELSETSLQLRNTQADLAAINAIANGDRSLAESRIEELNLVIQHTYEDSEDYQIITQSLGLIQNALNSQPEQVAIVAQDNSDILRSQQSIIAELQVENAALMAKLENQGRVTPLTMAIVNELAANSDPKITAIVLKALLEVGAVHFENDAEQAALEILLAGFASEAEEATTPEVETEEDVLAQILRDLALVIDATRILQTHVEEHIGFGAGGSGEVSPSGGGGDDDGGQPTTEEPPVATSQGEVTQQIAELRGLLAKAENLPSEVEKRLEEVLANLEALAEKLVADNNPVTISIALSDIGNPVVTVSPAGSQVATDGTAQAVVPQAIPAQPIQAVPQPYAAVYTPVASPELAGMQAQINNIYATLQGLAANQAAQAAMANPALAQQAGLPQQLSGSCEQLLREMQQQNATTNQVLERMGQLIEETRSGATDETVRSQIDEALERNNAQIAQEIGTAIAGALNPIREEISAMRTELNNALLARDAEWQQRMEEMEARYETQMAELREMLNQALESRQGNESDTLEGLTAELTDAERELGRLRLAEFLLTDLNLDGIRGIEGLDLNEVTLAALAAAIEAQTSSLEGLVAEGADEQNREQNLIRVEQLRNLLRIIQERETAGTPFQNPQELSDYLNNLSVEDYAAMLETRITALGDSTEPNVVFVRERLQLVLDNLNSAWSGMNEQARAETTTIRAFLDRRENNDETIDDVRRRITELNVRIADIRARIEALNNSAENTAPADNLAEAEPALVDAQANRAALEANLGALGAMLEAKPEKVKGWKKFLRAAAEIMTSMAGGLVMKAGIATLVGITVGATVLTGPMAIAIAGMTGAIGGAAFNGLFSAGLHYGVFHKEKHKIWAENHKKGNGVLYFFKNAIRKGTIEDYAIDDKLANLTAVFNKLGNADISSYTFADLEQFGISERDVLTAFRELLVLKELTNNVGLDGVELPNGVTFGSAGATVTATEAINRLATQIPAILNANGYDENRIASVQQLADEEVEKRYNDAFRSTILNKVIKGAFIGGFTGVAISALEHFFNNPATEAAKDEAAKGVADRMARAGASRVPENIAEARQDFNIQQVAELRKAGMDRAQIDALFAQADLNKDGVISGSAELAKVSVVNTGGAVTGVVGASGDFLPGATQLPSGWSSTLEARNLSDTWTLGPSGGEHGKLYIEVFNQVQDQVGSETFAQGATFDKVVWPAIQDGIRNGYNVDSSYITKLIEDAGLSSGAVAEGVVVATGSSGDAALVAALGSIGTAFEQNIQALEVINNAAGNVVGVAEQVTSPANAGVAVPEFIDNAAKQVVEVASNGWLMLAGALGAGVVSAALYSPDSENGVGGGAGNTGTGGAGGQGVTQPGGAAQTGATQTGAGTTGTGPGGAAGAQPAEAAAERRGATSELGIAPVNPENQTISIDPATGRFVAPANTWRMQTGEVTQDTNWLEFRNIVDRWANIAAVPVFRQRNPFKKQAHNDARKELAANNKYYLLENGRWYERSFDLSTMRRRENQIDSENQYKEIRKGTRDAIKKMVADVLRAEFPHDDPRAAQRLGKNDQWALAQFGEANTKAQINNEMVDSFWSLMMVLNDPANIGQDGKFRPDKAEEFQGIVQMMFARENQFMSTYAKTLNTRFTTYRGMPMLVSHALIVAALKLSEFEVNPVQVAQLPLSIANIDQLVRSRGEVRGGLAKGLNGIDQFNARGRFDWGSRTTTT